MVWPTVGSRTAEERNVDHGHRSVGTESEGDVTGLRGTVPRSTDGSLLFYMLLWIVCVCVLRPRRNPLFFVDILADSQGIHYSTPLHNFEAVLVSLFDKGIQACQNVPQLEKVGTVLTGASHELVQCSSRLETVASRRR